MIASERETTITTRRRVARVLVPGALFAIIAAGGMVGTALAQEKGGVDGSATASDQTYEHIAFDAADTDGDGRVGEAELARDAAAGFSGLDKDRNRVLTPDELGPHDPARFARVDRDGNGELTFIEVMTFKSQALEKADRNKDGYLSYEEMYNAVAAEAGE